MATLQVVAFFLSLRDEKVKNHEDGTKTGKTPKGDLDKAERLRKKYFELKDMKK